MSSDHKCHFSNHGHGGAIAVVIMITMTTEVHQAWRCDISGQHSFVRPPSLLIVYIGGLVFVLICSESQFSVFFRIIYKNYRLNVGMMQVGLGKILKLDSHLCPGKVDKSRKTENLMNFKKQGGKAGNLKCICFN